MREDYLFWFWFLKSKRKNENRKERMQQKKKKTQRERKKKMTRSCDHHIIYYYTIASRAFCYQPTKMPVSLL